MFRLAWCKNLSLAKAMQNRQWMWGASEANSDGGSTPIRSALE
jgi:hypothetical protein